MLTVITGGSGSGKSEFAERLATSGTERKRLYIATMVPFDEECRRKIIRHRVMRRERNFQTVECYTNLKQVEINRELSTVILLECMSNLVANEMYQDNGAGTDTVTAVVAGVKELMNQTENLIVVTNEVFSDGIGYEKETLQYMEYLGSINAELGKLASYVIEVVYTIPVVQKGGFLPILEKKTEKGEYQEC